jgi:hypothetical protein
MPERQIAWSSSLGRIFVLFFALPVLILTCAAAALAQGQAQTLMPAPPVVSPSAETLNNWRNGMAKVSPPSVASPNGGCFTASYPDIQWQEVPCAQGVTAPLFGRRPAGLQPAAPSR